MPIDETSLGNLHRAILQLRLVRVYLGIWGVRQFCYWKQSVAALHIGTTCCQHGLRRLYAQNQVNRSTRSDWIPGPPYGVAVEGSLYRCGPKSPPSGGSPWGGVLLDPLTPDAVFLSWAKKNRNHLGETSYQPLLYQCLDVAAVLDAIWRLSCSEADRARVAEGLGLSALQASGLVTFLAASHDIGKLTPVF